MLSISREWNFPISQIVGDERRSLKLSLIRRYLLTVLILTLVMAGAFGRLVAQQNGVTLTKPVEVPAAGVQQEGRNVFVIRLTEKDLERYLSVWRLSQPSADGLVEKLVASGCRRMILPDVAGSDRWKFGQELAIGLKKNGIEIWFELLADLSQDQKSKEVVLFDELRSEKAKTDFVGRAVALMKVVGADGKPVCSGFFMPLVVGQTLPGGLLSQLSAETFRRFVQEIKISEELSASLDTDEKRERFVKSTGLMPWLKWRSTKVAAFYGSLAANLDRETGQKMTFAAPPASVNTSADELSEIQKTAVSPLVAWREVGFEPEAWAVTEHYKLIISQTLSRAEMEAEVVDHPDLVRAMKGRHADGHWFGVGEPDGAAAGWLGRERYSYLQGVLTSRLAQNQPNLLIVDHEVVESQPAQLKLFAEKYQSLDGQGVVPAGSGAMLQGVSARIYGGPESWTLVVFNALPFRVQVGLHAAEAMPKELIRVIDSEITKIGGRGVELGKPLFNIPPNSWGRIGVKSERATELGISTEVPEDAKDIVQTRYEELVDNRPMATSAGGEAQTVEQSSVDRSRGRRLMAALQAYRERRLADFFRLSNGLTRDRGTKISRSLSDESEKRRITR
jgi:hypothetical protein